MTANNQSLISDELNVEKMSSAVLGSREDFFDDDNSDYDVYENDTKVNYKIFDNCEYYNNNVENFAKQQMVKFFEDKQLHCGGKIPQSLLYSSKRINLVVNLDLDSSIKIFYDFSEKQISEEELVRAKRTGEVSWDIIAVNEVLRLLAQSGVPQQFAGGMLLIYLELVKGHEIQL